MLALWSAGASTAVAYDLYAPDFAGLTVSDFSTPPERNATRLRFTRPITNAFNFQHTAPGSRVSFQTSATQVRLTFYWNNLVTYLSWGAGIISLLVDGAEVSTLTSTVPLGSAGSSSYIYNLAPGTKTLTIVWPYNVGLDLTSVEINEGASIASVTRPAGKLAIAGDSISHGLWASRTTMTWAYKLAVSQGRQLVNIANGGERAVAANGSALSGTGADRVVYLIGYNNFVAQTPQATFQADVEGWITNARSALPAAKIYILSMIYTPNTNTITPAMYRSASQSAEAAAGDSATYFVDGLSVMTNNSSFLADNIHPTDAGAAQIASVLQTVLGA